MYETTINNGTSNSVCRVYESVEEMLEAGRKVREGSLRLKKHDHVAHSAWVGRAFPNGWSSVYADLRSAWDEGISTLEGMLKQLEDADLPKPESRRRKPRFSEDNGDELDYDRLRSGRDYWRATRRQNTRGPATITLMVDVAANCNVRADRILWRGAAAIVLAKRLEEAGYRVELWAFVRAGGRYADDGRSVDNFSAVCLKRASDPLDVSTLINIVSGWAFRTVWFREGCQGTLRINTGFGWHSEPTAAELDLLNRDEHRIVIRDVWDHDAAVNIVRETLSGIVR